MGSRLDPQISLVVTPYIKSSIVWDHSTCIPTRLLALETSTKGKIDT